jgi:co-chaperonin GroES (HSP10)
MTKIAKETIEQKESIDKNNDAVKRFEERQKQKQVEKQSELDKAFVEQDKRVLDPTLLKKSLIDRMPEPTGWRVLVLPYRGKDVTDGGIQLVKSTIDRESHGTMVCYVLKTGPLAYKDKDRFGGEPWCKKGDWILIGRYSGARFLLEDDHEVRLINDDEVIGTILSPDDIKSL